MSFGDLGKWMIIAGLAIAAIGGLLWLLSRLPFIGNLPGDIRIQGENYSLFIPLGTMILLSIVLTIVVNIIARLFDK